MLGGCFDDPHVGLVRDHEVDVGAGELRAVERMRRRIGHRSDRVLEDLSPIHANEARSVLEHFRTERTVGSAGRATEQVAERTVTPDVGGQNSLVVLGALEDRGTRAVAEQHARRAVFPVRDGAQPLHPDNEAGLDVAKGHHPLGDRAPKDETGARRPHVERRGSARAKRRLQIHRRRW